MKKIFFVLALMFLLVGCEPSEGGRGGRVNTFQHHRVIFELSGGSGQTSFFVEEGHSLPELLEPTKVGYRFIGWYLDEQFSEPFDLSSPIQSPLTLFAGWEDCHFSLTLVNVNQSFRIAYQEPMSFDLELPDFYFFGGLFSDAALKEVYDNHLMPNQDLELYVKLIPYSFDDEFRAFGNVVIGLDFVAHGALIEPPPTPVFEGFEFVGWSHEMTSDDLIEDFVMPTQSVVMYAQYRPIVYVLEFVLPEGLSLPSRNYTFDTRNLNDVVAPTLEGYEFEGCFSSHFFQTKSIYLRFL